MGHQFLTESLFELGIPIQEKLIGIGWYIGCACGRFGGLKRLFGRFQNVVLSAEI